MNVSEQDKLKFHQDMIDLYKQGKRIGFNSTRFLNMINEYGGYEAACRLIAGDDNATGFTELWEISRLDLSMEYLIVHKWAHIFDKEQVKICNTRLKKLSTKPKTPKP